MPETEPQIHAMTLAELADLHAAPSKEASWVPYSAGVRTLEHMIRQLYLEKEQYRTRLLRLVQHNDLQREEIEDLKRKLRLRNLKGGEP